MKRFFILLAASLLSPNAGAQMLDSLYDDDDFQPVASVVSSAPAAPSVPAASSPAATAPAAQPAAPRFTPTLPSAPKPAPQPAPAASSKKAEQPPALPALGTGAQKENMPALGKRTVAKKDSGASLYEMRMKKRKKKTGASVADKFDVAGIGLKMNPDAVIASAREKGFTLKRVNRGIPELNEWRYKRDCLKGPAYGLKYSDMKYCIDELAKNDNMKYVQHLFFENKGRRERLYVDFTSLFSGNQAFRIRYVGKGDHSLGATAEGIHLKNKRRADFLRSLMEKYGQPDDEDALIWGGAGDGAVLSAEISDTFLDASIVLENTSLEDDDFDKMVDDDTKTSADGQFNF